MPTLVLGVDIGTSSSKGVVVDLTGRVIAEAVREHEVSRPFSGHVEMDSQIWWAEFISITRELTSSVDDPIAAVGVSGMGPCVLLTDNEDSPLFPAILYGVDTRATSQITRLTEELGAEAILERCGSALSTQSVGPKLAWLSEHKPDAFARAVRLYMPSSWLAFKLTGSYLLDHHSASQATPLYDIQANAWHAPWAAHIAPGLELPPLVWPGDVIGTVDESASGITGLPKGTPVVAGTIDAWAEAISVGAQKPGDLMLMYGTTMFLVNTLKDRVTAPGLWSTVGAFEGTLCLAGGMATSGAITGWLRKLFGSPDYNTLICAAKESRPGSNGLLMLPYFAGERTPIADPDARGVIIGLTLDHTAGDLYRAALEATALGVRHNLAAISQAGGRIGRVVAVGGGTRGGLWTQIVSDVTGLSQEVREVTIGASYGASFLAAGSLANVSIDVWNPLKDVVNPCSENLAAYDELFRLYLALYPATMEISHDLAKWQHLGKSGPV